MFNEDERDEDLDEEVEDADLDTENSDEEDDEDSEEGADDDDSSDEEDEDDKPVTRKELRELLKGKKNDSNAKRRMESKNRNISKAPKVEERISQIEQSQKKAELLEKKRTFGYENSLSPKQVDIVFRMTKRPTKKFLDEPYVKAALGAIASESNVRENTPGNSGRNFKSNGGKSWDKMDEKDKQDNFADRRRSILESKRK